MSKPLPLLILLLLPLMMMRVTPGATRSYTGCSAVTMDKETTVVCHFEEDIGQSGRGFNVQFFYPNHLEDPASEVVLMCNRRKSGGLVCRTSSDVNFDEHQAITDRLVLTRPASKDKEGGEYLCQAVPALPGPIRHCILTYIETPKQPTPSPTIPPTTEKDEDERVLPFLTVIFVFVLLIFLLFGVTLVVVIYLKRKRIRQWWTGHSKKRDVEDPAEPDPLDKTAVYIPQDQPDHTGPPDKNYRYDGSQPAGTPVDANTAQTDRQPADQPRQRGIKEQQQEMRRREVKKPVRKMQQLQGGVRPEVEQAEEAIKSSATTAVPLITPETITKKSPGSVAADQGEHYYDAEEHHPAEPLTKAQKKKAEQERKKAEQERKTAEQERAKQEKKETDRKAKEAKEAKKKADKEAKEAKKKGVEEKSESVAFLSDTTDQPGMEGSGHNRDLTQVHFSTANKQGKGVVTSRV